MLYSEWLVIIKKSEMSLKKKKKEKEFERFEEDKAQDLLYWERQRL